MLNAFNVYQRYLTYSKYIYDKDIGNLSIFGDAAAATLLSSDEGNHLIENFVLGTDGSGMSNLIVKNGGLRAHRDNTAKEISNGSNSYYTNNHLTYTFFDTY